MVAACRHGFIYILHSHKGSLYKKMSGILHSTSNYYGNVTECANVNNY